MSYENLDYVKRLEGWTILKNPIERFNYTVLRDGKVRASCFTLWGAKRFVRRNHDKPDPAPFWDGYIVHRESDG